MINPIVKVDINVESMKRIIGGIRKISKPNPYNSLTGLSSKCSLSSMMDIKINDENEIRLTRIE